jgi:hypothetical protein
MKTVQPTAEHLSIVRQMRAKARKGWYIGDRPSLERYAARRFARSATTNELVVQLLLSRDRMHHSVGWWRNADYECCWHLSLSAIPVEGSWDDDKADLPKTEVDHWAQLVFGEWTRWLWHEPGGTDPHLSPEERWRNRAIQHLRLFIDYATLEPIWPQGEVYHLTRFVEGLTPEKVDR